MRFAESKAEITKGNYFPLFGFGTIDKGRLTHDKFVVYNPDASGRGISLNYGEQAISHTKVDSVVTSNKVDVTESENPKAVYEYDKPVAFSSGVISESVGISMGSGGELVEINHAVYEEKDGNTPTVNVLDNVNSIPYTLPLTAVANQFNSLFRNDNNELTYPFTIDGGETLVLLGEQGFTSEWILTGKVIAY